LGLEGSVDINDIISYSSMSDQPVTTESGLTAEIPEPESEQ